MYNKLRFSVVRRRLVSAKHTLTSKSVPSHPADKVNANAFGFPRHEFTPRPPSLPRRLCSAIAFEQCRGYPLTNLNGTRLFSTRTGSLNPPVHDVESRRAPDPYVATEIALDAVVKIFTVSCSPNYFLPWQNKPQREVTGSGEFGFWFMLFLCFSHRVRVEEGVAFWSVCMELIKCCWNIIYSVNMPAAEIDIINKL